MIANHLWQSTLVALAAGVLTVALRRNRAAVRYWVWFAASMKFLVPFAALGSVGARLHLDRWSAAAPRSSDFDVVLDLVAHPFATPVVPRPLEAAAAPLGATAALAWVLLAVWACGSIAVLATWMRRWVRLRSDLRRCRAVERGREVDILRRVEGQAGGNGRTALAFSSAAHEPCVWGITNPILRWPQSLSARLSDAQIAAIVAHELAHIRRRDNLTAAAHTVVQALWWWHPIVWWLGGRLVAERELACDADVIHRGNDRRVYAESILKTCAFCVQPGPVWAAGVAGSDLQRRIEAIMRNRPEHLLGRSKKLLVAACAIAVVAMPIAAGARRAPRAAVPSHAERAAAGPAFASASITPNTSGAPNPRGLGFPRGGQFFAENVSLRDLIRAVYGHEFLAPGRIVGGPDWVDTERYDVRAQAHGDPIPDERQSMVRTLLADRFKLVLHTEQRAFRGYSLTASGALGSRLRASSAICPEPGAPPPPPPAPGMVINLCGVSRGRDSLSGEGATMWQLALLLERELGRAAVDRTGLDGRFDFTLDWSSAIRPAADLTQQTENRHRAIASALQEQLGLTILPATVDVDVLVIDSAARPPGL